MSHRTCCSKERR